MSKQLHSSDTIEQLEQLDLADVPQELLATAIQFQERINSASAGEKTKIAQELREELKTLVKEYNNKESAELAEVKAHVSHKAEIARHHREMYHSDALYKAQTDAIAVGGDMRMKAADERQKEADNLAADYGITTEYDDEVTQARKKYEAARANNADNAPATREAELEWHRLRLKQTFDREQQLRDAGHPDAADRMRDHSRTINKDFTDAMDAYDQQTKALREAKRRALRRALNTAAEREELEKLDQMLKSEREGLLKNANVKEVNSKVSNLESELKTLLSTAEAEPEPYQPQPRFAMAEASAADNYAPVPSPVAPVFGNPENVRGAV